MDGPGRSLYLEAADAVPGVVKNLPAKILFSDLAERLYLRLLPKFRAVPFGDRLEQKQAP
jgi:hypothetical protein